MTINLRLVQSNSGGLWEKIWAASNIRLVCLFCLLCISAICADAQSSSGTVTGIVTDQTGASVPKASVTLTRVDTSTKTMTVTDSSGRYQFVNVTPGPYQVDVDASGFKHFTRTSLDVQVASSLRIDAILPIGSTSEVVQVTSDSPLIDVQTATVGQVVEGRTVQETPLNGRNVMNLLTIAPGVVAQGSTDGAAQGNQNGGGHTNNAAFGNYQIGGGTAGQSAQFLDGVPLNILGSNTVALIPTQDSVQEFRVDINGVSPQYGRFAGGVVSITTKSGANLFHGSTYEYLRNTILDANNYFTKQAGQSRPGLHQNQYGGTLGGPIRKNKLFFFGSVDRYHFTQGYPFQTNVPTLAQRGGDFSAQLGPPLPITNPCTGMPVFVGQIFDPYSTRTVNTPIGPQVCRTPFFMNKIDPSRFDKTANYILNTAKYFPAPNTNSPAGNFYSTTPVGGQSSQYVMRSDYAISTKQNMFARYTYFGLNDLSQNVFSNLTGNPPSHDRSQQAVIGDTFNFNPTTVLDVRASYTRNYFDNAATSIGTNLSSYGPAYGSLQSQVSFAENPEILLGPSIVPPQDDDFLMNFEDVTSFQWANSYVVSANVSKLLGKHSLNFGADVRRLENNTTGQSTTPSGSFSFLGTFTSFNNNLPPTGDKVADLLLGTPETGVLSTVHSVAQFEYYQGYYLNDSWQATPRLTVNGGIRWEIPGVYHERHNLGTVLQPNATDPLGVTGYSLKGQLALLASSQYGPTGTLNEHYGLFAPRIGLAYQVDPKTAFRAAYGITYPPSDVFVGAAPSLSQVNSSTTNMVTSTDGGLTPHNTLSSPFPANGTVGNTAQTVNQPTGRNPSGLTALEGQTITGPVTGQRYSYTQQFNVNVERQFGDKASFQIGYLGSKGTLLPLANQGLDQLPDTYDSMGNALLTQVANPFAGKVSPISSLNGPTVPAGQLLRPYPQFTNVTNSTPFHGSSTYHSLQVQSQVRLGGGGTIISSYTWAKLLSDTDTLNGYLESGSVGATQDFTNLHADKSLSTFNVEHRFVTTYIADLPVGRGKRFLNRVNSGVDRLVGGWGLNGITTFQSGFPLVITAQTNSLSNYFGAGVIRPNIVPGCNPLKGGSSQSKAATGWFNTACFTQPADFTFGNENRVDPRLRSAGIANWDAALFKKTQLHDRALLELRMEVFNVFNRVQFGVPGTQIGGFGAGSVSSTANSPRILQVAGKITF